LTLAKFARVDKFPRSQEQELIKESDNIASRLVDGEDDSAVVVACEGYKTFHYVEGVVGIEATGWLVQEEN